MSDSASMPVIPGGGGFLLSGLFLSAATPKKGDKGLLVDGKYFIPIITVSRDISGSASSQST